MSSKAWTTVSLLCRSDPGDGKPPIGVGKPAKRVDKPCTAIQNLWKVELPHLHTTMMRMGVSQADTPAEVRRRL